MSVQPVPDGYSTVTPYIIAQDVSGLISFLEKALGATIVRASRLKDGTAVHAEVRIGNSAVMFGAARNGFAPMPTSFYIYVDDCDALYRRAVAADAESISQPAEMFYGDRHGGIRDPAGNYWWIATHIKDVSDEELQRITEERG